MTWWAMQGPAPHGTSSAPPNASYYSMSIYGPQSTFSTSISGKTMTVTGSVTGNPIAPGMVLTSGVSGGDIGTFILAFGTNGTTGAGGAGTYALQNPTNGNLTTASGTYGASPITTWPGQSQTNFNWLEGHA